MGSKTQKEYLAEFMAEMDAKSQLWTARSDGLEEGEGIGFEKGEAIGREKRMAEGLIKGEKKARIETARNLKSMNLSIEAIAEATVLTEDQVQQL